ncbi:sce7726 family protein [Paraprevotella xylaniphila]|uniref:sce7726 family protein n=1 Tax=Paraprevotella xylaniphila TaxID=454155 RepID=UPI0039F5354A
MKKYGLQSAEYIKCLFIDYLLSRSKELIIGNELMYGIKRKVVDLVVLQNKKIIAVEIKSDSDNLSRLEEQISEYKKIFDYVLIITTEKHANRISEIAPSEIGIYVFKENLLMKKFRNPRIQRNKDKVEMLYSINAKYLYKLEGFTLSKYDTDEIRLKYAKRRTSSIQEILLMYLTQKYKERFTLFMNERGLLTHIEDLSILSSSFQIE